MKELKIGVLLDDLEGMYAGNIWPELLKTGKSLGVSLVLFIGRTYWPDDGPGLNQFLFIYDISVNSDLDGWIVVGSISIDWSEKRKKELFTRFTSIGKPLVTIGVKYDGIPNVTSDVSGIRETVRYFKDHGRKNIAFVTGVMNVQDAQDRLKAFRDGMKENGLAWREDRVVQGLFTYDSGYAAADRILELCGSSVPEDRVDAVISSNDEMAFGLLHRFREKGVRVPEDIGLVGFDDSETARLTKQLASVDPALKDQAGIALLTLVSCIRDGSMRPDDITVPSRLVVRGSIDAAAVTEDPGPKDERVLSQIYRPFEMSLNYLIGYFNKSDDHRHFFEALARYLVPNHKIGFCQILLFPEPVAAEVFPETAVCRPVFLSRDYKTVYSLEQKKAIPLRGLTDELMLREGNSIIMALTQNNIKFGYIVFDLSIVDAAFVYEELRSIISIFLKHIADYQALVVLNRKKEQDLQIARSVQEKFLTFRMAKNDVIDIDALYKPLLEVSGDFYHINELSDGKIAVLIGDVTGHGMSAAMIASMAIMGMQIYQRMYSDPSDVLARINDQIYSILPDYFLTAFYAVIDCAERTVTYSNAGHPYPLLYRKETGKIEVLESQGKLIGCFEDAQLKTRSSGLSPGDRLLIFTDGITECTDRNENEFGEERLREMLKKPSPVHEFFGVLMEELGRFNQGSSFEDDITAVLIEMREDPPRK